MNKLSSILLHKFVAMTNKKHQVCVDIPYEVISNMLKSALEGGSNYWYMITDTIEPEKFEYVGGKEGQMAKHPHLYAMNEGGALMIDDSEADEPTLKEPVRLDGKAIQNGLESMSKRYRSHFADVLNDNTDATTADVFLQCCVLGEAIHV